jgi:hypothetical protein
MLHYLVTEWNTHLDDNKMNWSQHFIFAGGHAVSVLVTAFKLITHSIFPCFFPTAGANLLTKLKKDFTDNG